jgi:poly(3-hydroxybutyrate) depolymerase
MMARRSLIAATAAFAFLLALTFATPAGAGEARRKDYPCKGCLFDPPSATGSKAPLLVVLHGDGDLAANAASPWEKAARTRGIALFSPQCPTTEGCKGSFWKWDGEPKWLDDQVKTIEGVHAIDPERIWLVGWSGGASYLGWRAAELGGRYAAVAYTGGGMPPSSKTTCPSCALPVYFMVGDGNPLHYLAKSLRDYFDACGGEVVWDLQKGANHGGELVALGKTEKVATILDWLEAHPRKCAMADAGLASAIAPSVSAQSAPSIAPSPPSSSADPTPPKVHGRCGCSTPGGPHDVTSALATLSIALAWLTRRGAAVSRRGTASRTE